MAYNTWDPNDKGVSLALSNGNLTVTATNGYDAVGIRAVSALTEKTYWEITVDEVTAYAVGVANLTWPINPSTRLGVTTTGTHGAIQTGSPTADWGQVIDGVLDDSGSLSDRISPLGTVVGLAFDPATSKLWASINGVWYGNGAKPDPAAGVSPLVTLDTDSYYPALSLDNDFATVIGIFTANFGATPFVYPVPEGYNNSVAPPQVAGGNLSLPLSITSSGRILRRHGSAYVQLVPTAASTGKFPLLRGDTSLLLSLEIEAVGRIPTLRGDASLLLQPAITAAGNASFNDATGEITLLVPEVSVTVINSPPMVGTVTFPKLSLSGSLDPLNEITLPLPQITGTVLTGSVATASVKFPKLQVTSTIAPYIIFAETLPALQVTATVLSGKVLDGDLSIALPKVTGTILSGELLSSAIVLRAPSVEGTLLSAVGGSCSLALPLPVVEAMITSSGAAARVFSVCLNNFRSSEYDNYDFHSYGSLGQAFIGAADDGLYLLEGDDDLGEEILSEVIFGSHDYATEKFDGKHYKRALMLFVEADTASVQGVMRVGETEYVAPAVYSRGDVNTVRMRFPRSVKFRDAEFGLRNVDGADFEVTAMELALDAQERKLA